MTSSQIYRDAVALPYVYPTEMTYGIEHMTGVYRSPFTGQVQSASRNAWQARASLRYVDLSSEDRLLMKSFLSRVQGQGTLVAVPDFRQPNFVGTPGTHATRMICSDITDADVADAPGILDHDVWETPDGFVAIMPNHTRTLQLRSTTNPASGTARRVQCTTPIVLPTSRLVACRAALRAVGTDEPDVVFHDVRLRYGPAVGSTSNTMIFSAQQGYYTTVFWTTDVQTQYLNIQYDTSSSPVHTGLIVDRLELMPAGQANVLYQNNHLGISNMGVGTWQSEGSCVEIGGTLQTLNCTLQNTCRATVYPGLIGLGDVASNAVISHLPHHVMRLADQAWNNLTSALNYDSLTLDFIGDPSGGADFSN